LTFKLLGCLSGHRGLPRSAMRRTGPGRFTSGSRLYLLGEDGGDVLGRYSVQVQVNFGRVLDRGPWLWERPGGPRHSCGSGYRAPRTRGRRGPHLPACAAPGTPASAPGPAGSPGGVLQRGAGLPAGVVPAAVRVAQLASAGGPLPAITAWRTWAMAARCPRPAPRGFPPRAATSPLGNGRPCSHPRRSAPDPW
jgi:hypothetical protein